MSAKYVTDAERAAIRDKRESCAYFDGEDRLIFEDRAEQTIGALLSALWDAVQHHGHPEYGSCEECRAAWALVVKIRGEK